MSVFLADGRAFGLEGDGDSFINIENLRGSEVSDALYGNDLENRIDGGRGGDFIDGGGGADVLTGGDGYDAFYFDLDSAVDVITDFHAGAGLADALVPQLGSSFDRFSELMAVAEQIGADTVFTFDSDTRLVLLGVNRNSLVQDDFVFT